jgi:hypothetical protein
VLKAEVERSAEALHTKAQFQNIRKTKCSLFELKAIKYFVDSKWSPTEQLAD